MTRTVFTRHPWLATAGITIGGWIWVLAGERAIAQARLAELRADVAAIEAGNAKRDERSAAIQLLLAELRADVRWIRQELDK